MQHVSIYTQFIDDKPKLFSAVIFAVIAILVAPIIIPNLFHGYHTLHIGLHIGGVIIATFLTVATTIAYAKIRTRRLLLTCIAFSFFITAESIALIDITWPYTFYVGQLTLEEIEHVLIISMLGVFASAVFRKD